MAHHQGDLLLRHRDVSAFGYDAAYELMVHLACAFLEACAGMAVEYQCSQDIAVIRLLLDCSRIEPKGFSGAASIQWQL